MISLLVGAFCLTFLSQPGQSIILHQSSPLRLWSQLVEVGAKTLRVPSGHRFSVNCDGSISPSRSVAHLSWYGPNRQLIADEGYMHRVRIERALTSRFQKLHFRPVNTEDSGRYICRGHFLVGPPVAYRYFDLVVVDEDQHTLPTTTTAQTVRTTTIHVTTPPENLEQTTESADNCTHPNFLCGSGECFEASYRCDKFPDCQDESDEDGCVGDSCVEGTFGCADGSKCIQHESVCNTVIDCPDGSDETDDACTISS